MKKRLHQNRAPIWRMLSLAIGLVPAQEVAAGAERAGIDFFERKIRPVLVQHCYECHSAEAQDLGGKLLLDSRDGILRGGESGPAVVAGKPDESLIIQAIRGKDEDMVMPPDGNDLLAEAVVHDFEEWVKMGAPDPRAVGAATSNRGAADQPHWSFTEITDPEAPTLADDSWPRDAIDRFVLARLEAGGQRPVADAPPEVLARRLYFDLTGLAPTVDDLSSFVAAFQRTGQKAVEQLVDTLLASPQFGERWGRHWLDVARYGESNGNDGLGRNPTFPHAWRYRDYVIQAFNEDLPYDRFIKQQIAGDLLPVTSAAQRNRNLVATGFLAIGFKPAVAMNSNFAMDVVDDQIDVVSTAVMGLSVSCARCHDHKHDPIPTRDYYALAGIFTSTETLWGKAGNEGLTAPPTPLHELRDTLDAPGPEAKAKAAGDPPPKFAADYGATIDELKPALHARLDAKPAGIEPQGTVAFASESFAKFEEARLSVGQQIAAESYSVSFWFRNDVDNSARPITAYLLSHAADGDDGQNGDNLGIGGTHEAANTGKLFIWTGKDADQNLRGKKVIAPGSWNHIVLVRSGKMLRVYLNGDEKPELEGEAAVAVREDRQLFVAARNDRFAPLQGFMAELAVFDRALSAEEAQRLHAASGQPPGTREAPRPAFAMGVRERQAIADAKINIDGNSGKLGPLVPRGFLSACETRLSPPTIGAGSSGRLQLADWLTRGDHPQTARVMANRVWLHLFGRGIVATPDDFGIYGARPSHPELLDHLATRFMADGWSMKSLIRTIVLSRTYQLDSRCDDEALLRADPDNILLGRHSRRRLDAESLRDRLLQASGRLKLQPAVGSAVDDVDQLINWPPGEAQYLHEPSDHRSVYLCMLRSSPPPELAAFDFPDGIDSAGQREVTSPPTQALFLLNNPLVVEQARSLAEHCLAIEGDDEARVAEAYRRTLQREPSPAETGRALEHVRQLERELDGGDARLRAWASFSQALLASNEFRYID